MLGVDVYNAILVLRTDDAVKGFRTHNLTLGSELGIAAGPLGGAGVSGEMGLKSPHKAPIFSYVQSRGFYAGISLVGQAFLDRFDENERVYQSVLVFGEAALKALPDGFVICSWEGIKAGDIFDGKVRRPPESKAFYTALLDAETGAAQGANLEWDTDEVKSIELEAGEVLRLPPTPDQLSEWEAQGIKDEEDIRFEEEERKAVRALPPPPVHPRSKVGRSRPGSSASSFRSGIHSGANSPEIHASDSYPASPLSRGHLSPASAAAMSPPPPPPRRRLDQNQGLGLVSVVESDSPTHHNPDDSLDLHTLSLDGATSTSAANAAQTSEESRRSPSPPPTFEQAVSRPSSPPREKATAEEIKQEAERSLQVPPPLNHQDSESSVSVYSDATDDKREREDAGADMMSDVVLDDNLSSDKTGSNSLS